ncbi:MAG: diguanylate cyclase [Rudaea sp.]|nr:diguanylate cyclase [Rudaea sp.]
MRIVRGILASALLLLASPGYAQTQTAQPARPIDLSALGAPAFTTFSTRDGVPDEVIIDLQTDRDGFVWLASSQGLARYDGQHWNADDAPAIKGVLGEFFVDHAGTLWVAFRDRGLARFDGRQWHFEDFAGSSHASARALDETVDPAGHFELWAATFGAGVLLRDHGHWVPAPGNSQLPAMATCVIRTHTIGGRERIWVGTGAEGLWYREDGDWQRFRDPRFDAAQIEYLLTATHAGHEELWISTFGSGLWRLDGNGLRAWTVASGDVPSNDFYTLAQSHPPDGDRDIWAASRAGLVRVHNDRAEAFDRSYGLPSDVVRGLNVWRSPDGYDVLWLATEGGVARTIIGANPWKTASLMGARGSGVFGVIVEPDGSGGERLWVASSADGLGLYEHAQWRIFTPSNSALAQTDLRFIKHAPDELGEPALWIGMENGGLQRVREGPRFESIAVPWKLGSGQAVTDVLGREFDGRHEQWFATRASGLYRRREGKWTSFHPDGSGSDRITALAEQIDTSGRSWLWATAVGGLLRFDGTHADMIGRESGIPDDILIGITLLPDARGRQILWIGTANHGILRVDASDPRHPVVLAADLPPAPDPFVYGAQRDSTGHIYICTNNGVQKLTPTPGGYESRSFARRDGMVHDECNTNAQMIDAHDRFWTGTLGGLTVFDPAREVRDQQSKPLKLTDVRIGDTLVDGMPVRVPPSQHDLRIGFALLSWRDESASSFRTQLVGYEPVPGAWSAQNFRSFNSLPPGDYTLRVEARDYAGNASTPLQVPISILPEWWQQGWARLALAAAALAFAYVLLQWRTRRYKAQQRQLEKLVSMRTAELHDANARLVELSYKDALTGLANRRRLLETLDATPDIGYAAPATALIFVDVDHFKAYNDRHGHPAGDEALRSVAAALRACAPANALLARYGGEEFACLLPATEAARARAIAEQFRAAVEACQVPIPGTDDFNRVTISAGVAVGVIASNTDAHRLLRDADIALYQAKRDGRNCVRG